MIRHDVKLSFKSDFFLSFCPSDLICFDKNLERVDWMDRMALVLGLQGWDS